MTSNSDLTHTLLALEQRLFQPEVRHSRQELERLLAEDFVEIGSSGKIYDRAAIIVEVGSEQGIEITLSDFRVRSLSPEVALVTYHAVISDTASQKSAHSLRSSLWRMIGGAWRMVFHQGTPTESR